MKKIQCGALKGDSSPMLSPKSSSSSSSIYDSDLRLADTGQVLIGLSDPSVYPIYQLFGSTSIHLETEADSSGTQQHEPSSADTEHRYPPLHGTSLMGFINPLWKQKWVPLLLLLTIALSLCRKTFSSSDHLPSLRHLPNI